MGLEIERKYLVIGNGWKTVEPVFLCQGYLNTDKHRTVRVRTAGREAFLTIKGETKHLTRAEYEYPIPLEDAKSMLKLCVDSVVKKNRYTVTVEDLVWEIDEFFGANKGLLVAEVELESEAQDITLPGWIGKEVSGERKYYNSSLATAPFNTWEPENR